MPGATFRLPLLVSTFKNKIFLCFESDLLHILLAERYNRVHRSSFKKMKIF